MEPQKQTMITIKDFIKLTLFIEFMGLLMTAFLHGIIAIKGGSFDFSVYWIIPLIIFGAIVAALFMGLLFEKWMED